MASVVSHPQRSGIHRRVTLGDAPLILVVDDAEEHRLPCAKYFESMNFRVEHAVDGEHALFKVMQFTPDVVVMALTLPVLDGWSAIEQMRAHPKMCSIPVVALTVNATETCLNRAHDAGADVVLAKPCTPEELHVVVCDLLNPEKQE